MQKETNNFEETIKDYKFVSIEKEEKSEGGKIIELLEIQNKLLGKNTLFTASGAIVGLVALIISIIAIMK